MRKESGSQPVPDQTIYVIPSHVISDSFAVNAFFWFNLEVLHKIKEIIL